MTRELFQGWVFPRGAWGWRTKLFNVPSRPFPPVAAPGKQQVDLMDRLLQAGRREGGQVLSMGDGKGPGLINYTGMSQRLRLVSCFLKRGQEGVSKGLH